MYRFLLTPRWLAFSVLALLSVPFCVFMGSWQLSRFEGRVDQHKSAVHSQSAAAAAKAVPLTAVLPTARAQVNGDDSGRLVSATGRYDAAHQLLVPDRSLDGRTGYYVLTPLRIGGGGAALPVVRGWLPGDVTAARAAAVPAAPTGEVTVTGALQYPESSDTAGVYDGGALPAGQLGIISAASLVNVLPYPVYGGWITAADPAAPLKAVPTAAPPDSGLDLRAFQNLGYTGEWFVFAGFAVFMWFRLVRREGEARSDAALGLLPDRPGLGGHQDRAQPVQQEQTGQPEQEAAARSAAAEAEAGADSGASAAHVP
ncbi:SURF1 family protein [Streptomyces sp. CA-111067]|uniref:SURF1 family protein n=1 Tax=Streptomyces sp. CA-111067 TaxID=3240046 RepID=UPI003D9A083F